MKVIGVTGGIGAGKSTVSDYLIQKGFPVIDADKIAREITEPGSDVLEKLANSFGDEILQTDGRLNRKKLGALVFADSDKKLKLDEITHRAILQRMLSDIAQGEAEGIHKVMFFDAALLFETGLQSYADNIWLVDSKDDIRVERLKQRDQLTEEEIYKRIKNQMSREEKLRRADVVLDNSKDKEALYLQIDKLLKDYE